MVKEVILSHSVSLCLTPQLASLGQRGAMIWPLKEKMNYTVPKSGYKHYLATIAILHDSETIDKFGDLKK